MTASEHGNPRDPGDTPGDPAANEPMADEPILSWWQRSAPKAAGAALAIGAATLWFGNMLSRVPLDEHAIFSYLLMVPLLLIVPAFSLAALRLSWVAFGNRQSESRTLVVIVALTAAVFNLLAMARFGGALWRIFSN